MLDFQIDYLQQKNADLTGRLHDTEGRAQSALLTSGSLDNRNVQLESELQSVDRMAQRLQMDKESTVKAADREITEAKVQQCTSVKYPASPWYFNYVCFCAM